VYSKGDGVSKDKAKAWQHCEKAAIAGCVTSRLNLGIELDKFNAGNFDRALKHWLIAASCDKRSLCTSSSRL
jgi:TPR repeat protein